jgi:twitching motility protein PilT
MVSTSLRGVISQTLCKKIGGGRVAAYEILYSTPAVANLIRESKSYQIYSVIQTSRGSGMMTLNDSLIELVRKRVVDPKEAYMLSVNKTEFNGMLNKEGFSVGSD